MNALEEVQKLYDEVVKLRARKEDLIILSGEKSKDLLASSEEVKRYKTALEKIVSKRSEYDTIGGIAREALIPAPSSEVCEYKHVGNAYYDTECGIEGELILDDNCRNCGKKIKQEV